MPRNESIMLADHYDYKSPLQARTADMHTLNRKPAPWSDR
jgi:hypothetical protein